MKKIIIVSLLLFLFQHCFGVSSGTFTVNQWGTGNYTTLASAESGLQGVLISTCYIVITGSWTVADGVTTFAGWTTFSTAPVIVQTTGLSRHSGIWNENAYKIRSNLPYGIGFIVNIKHIYIDGLQIDLQDGDPSANDCGIYELYNGSNDQYRNFSNNYIRYSGSTTVNYNNRTGMALDYGKRGIYKIWNNILQDFYTGMLVVYCTTGSTYYIYNNTIKASQSDIGMSLSAQYSATQSYLFLYLKNNLVQGTTFQGYVFQTINYGIRCTSACNISSDATSPNTDYGNLTVSFLNGATNWLLLSSTDTVAIDKARDLSADSGLSFNTDIIGTIRPSGVAWDIGANEYIYPTVSATKRRIRRPIVLE